MIVSVAVFHRTDKLFASLFAKLLAVVISQTRIVRPLVRGHYRMSLRKSARADNYETKAQRAAAIVIASDDDGDEQMSDQRVDAHRSVVKVEVIELGSGSDVECNDNGDDDDDWKLNDETSDDERSDSDDGEYLEVDCNFLGSDASDAESLVAVWRKPTRQQLKQVSAKTRGTFSAYGFDELESFWNGYGSVTEYEDDDRKEQGVVLCFVLIHTLVAEILIDFDERRMSLLLDTGKFHPIEVEVEVIHYDFESTHLSPRRGWRRYAKKILGKKLNIVTPFPGTTWYIVYKFNKLDGAVKLRKPPSAIAKRWIVLTKMQLARRMIAHLAFNSRVQIQVTRQQDESKKYYFRRARADWTDERSEWSYHCRIYETETFTPSLFGWMSCQSWKVTNVEPEEIVAETCDVVMPALQSFG